MFSYRMHAVRRIRLCLDEDGLRRESVHGKLIDFEFGGYSFEESGVEWRDMR